MFVQSVTLATLELSLVLPTVKRVLVIAPAPGSSSASTMKCGSSNVAPGALSSRSTEANVFPGRAKASKTAARTDRGNIGKLTERMTVPLLIREIRIVVSRLQRHGVAGVMSGG